MRRDEISHTQLTALVWAGILAPAAELLPALLLPEAGKGAWLAPAAAIPLVLLGGWLLGVLSRERGLARAVRDELGPVAGGGLLLIYMVWGEILLALRLRLCAQRLLSLRMEDGALWFFLLAVAGMVLWMGRGKVSAFARAGQFFLAALLTAAGVVLILSLLQGKTERVLPLWRGDLLPVVKSALPAAGVLGWGMFGAFLAGAVPAEKGQGSWRWSFWGAGGCLLLTLAQWTVLSNLGPALAGRLEDPFFALAKSVGVEGAFQRVESVVVTLWTLSDITMCVLILFSQRAMGRELRKGEHTEVMATGAVLLAVVAALAAFPRGEAERWSREIVPLGNLLLGVVVPAGVLAVGMFRGKRKGKGISCGR